MTNDDELKDATYRVGRCKANESLLVVYDTPSPGIAMIAYREDCEILAEAHCARLAADKQREREDAEPITGHVIASLMPKEQFGEALYTNASFVLSSGIRLSIGGVIGDDGGFSVAIHGTPTITTRGQLRKLLEVLKGGA